MSFCLTLPALIGAQIVPAHLKHWRLMRLHCWHQLRWQLPRQLRVQQTLLLLMRLMTQLTGRQMQPAWHLSHQLALMTFPLPLSCSVMDQITGCKFVNQSINQIAWYTQTYEEVTTTAPYRSQCQQSR